MDKIIALNISDVVVGVQFPIEITSVERCQQILNNSEFREQYGLENMFFRQERSLGVNLCPLYFGCRSDMHAARVLKHTGSDDELISKGPMCVAYADGGFEYLSGFTGQGTDQPFYKNELIMPSNLGLIFYHPIKDKKLVELVTK